jgi:hypothetical protein
MPTPQESPYRPESGEFWALPEEQPYNEEEPKVKVPEGKGPHILSFQEAKFFYHFEDQRQLWLCNREDNPGVSGKGHLFKELHVSLKEFVPMPRGLML